MSDDIDMAILSAGIKDLYDKFHETVESIKNYNRKYDFENSESLFFLETLLKTSYKPIVDSLYNNDSSELSHNYMSILYKMTQLHKLSLSEIAHKKLKRIEFEIHNFYFHNDSRKEYREIKLELNDLDDKYFNEKDITDEMISDYQQIISKMQNLEDTLEDEKKSGLYSQIPNMAYILAPILLTIEGFILAEYIVFNPYIPLIGYILVLFLAYFILKSPIDFSLLYNGSLNKKNLFLHFVLLAGMATYGIMGFSTINSNIILKSICIGFFFVFVYVYFLFIKTLIVSQKKSILDKEFTNIYEKYVEL